MSDREQRKYEQQTPRNTFNMFMIALSKLVECQRLLQQDERLHPNRGEVCRGMLTSGGGVWWRYYCGLFSTLDYCHIILYSKGILERRAILGLGPKRDLRTPLAIR